MALPQQTQPIDCYSFSWYVWFRRFCQSHVTLSEYVPMLHEITRTIRRLNKRRAAGTDNITAQHLKDTKKPVSEALHKVINTIWYTGRVPAERKEGIIVWLDKHKRSQSDYSNYNPKSVLTKLITSICTNAFTAHSASTWQILQTSTFWFYCRAIYYGCHISVQSVCRITPKF